MLYNSTTLPTANGFIGTFDGRGHTIEGMTFAQGSSSTDSLTGKTLVGCGLFTAIGNEGVVKNLAITGCSGTGSEKGAFLGLGVRGTVENLSIKITTAGKTVQNAGILCATVTDSAHFENIIVDFSSCEPNFNGSNTGLLWAYMGSNTTKPLTVKGVYVIGERGTDDNAMITNKTIWCGGTTQNARMLNAITKNGDCAAYFWSVEDFAAGLETLSIKAGETSGYQKDSTEAHNAWAYIEANFDSTIWDLSNKNELPVFKAQA